MHQAELPTYDSLDALLIDSLQGGFPLSTAPYAEVAASLGLAERTLLQRLDTLLARKVLTRFGPLFQIERMGGAFVLAALAVPEARYDSVAAQLFAMPAVAHNYRREHALNMWFVLATATPDGIAVAITEIERATGLTVYAFPKLREYYVGMRFAVGGTAAVGTQPPTTDGPPLQLDDADWRLVRAVQHGLPLCGRPYRLLGEGCGLSEDEVRARLAAMLAGGIIRRIGAVPNHYAIGYAANGMAVFDVDDEQVDALGEAMGRQPCVSHCYRRQRQLPLWRYNLFAMCHAADRDTVLAQVDALRAQLGAACREHQVLFSTRILKKSGLRV